MLNTTQIALLEAIKASLFGTEPNYPKDTDWTEVVKEAKAQTVLGIISPVIPVKDVSVEMGKATYMRILYEQDKLIKLLDANDIPCVILKGSAAAQYYPKPYLRAMGDVDFLVSHEDFYSAKKLLEDNGYQYQDDKDKSDDIPENKRHIEYCKNGIEFELHQHFSSPRYNIDDILEHGIKNREYQQFDGFTIPVLPDIENGLVLLGHINQHLGFNNLGLRQIIDWEMYVDKVRNIELWKTRFLPIIKSIGLEKLFLTVMSTCITYFGLSNTVGITVKSDDSVLALVDILFNTGNFGLKTLNSIENNNDNRVSTSIYNIRYYGFFQYFRNVGISRCKLFQKHKFLTPVAFIYGILRSAVKGLERIVHKDNVYKQIQNGRDRYLLNNKLGVKTKDE